MSEVNDSSVYPQEERMIVMTLVRVLQGRISWADRVVVAGAILNTMNEAASMRQEQQHLFGASAEGFMGAIGREK